MQKAAANDMPSAATWEVLTKKMPATSAGTKLQNKEKPAVRELLTAGVGCVDKKDTRYKRGHKISE